MKEALNFILFRSGGDDAGADRRTYYWVAGFFISYFIVNVLSQRTEITRFGLSDDLGRYVIYEASSIAIILALYPFMRWTATLASPGERDWRQVLAVHAAGAIAFSIVHIALMVAIRKAIFLLLYGAPYIFTDNLPREFIYELRKDTVTYALIVFFITFGRQLEQQGRELAAAREDAKRSKRLTLKCGGRQIFVDAAEVIWVKSASNYVEVAAGGKTHLARATLAGVERQLADAGAEAVRVHRSWIVNADAIAKIDPTGEGDVKIEMRDGTIVPGSRRYRDRLPAGS